MADNDSTKKWDFFNIRPLGQESGRVQEVEIVDEHPIEKAIKKDDADAKRANQKNKNIAGLVIISVTLIAALYIFLFGAEESNRFETAEKLIFLIIGSILGFLYGNSKED